MNTRPLPDPETTHTLVVLLVHVRPALTAAVIWEEWERDPILSDYSRPTLRQLAEWLAQD